MHLHTPVHVDHTHLLEPNNTESAGTTLASTSALIAWEAAAGRRQFWVARAV